jgi:hypothetical protein
MVREEFALRFSSPDRAWMKRTFEMIFVSTIYSAATRELAGLDTPTTSELIQTLLHGAIMRPAGIEDQS